MKRKSYTLQEVTRLLGGIAPKTLREWMDKSGMQAQQDKRDPRRWLLSWEQIEQLAAAHGRIVGAENAPVADPLAALEARLLAEIRRLERRVAKLEQERLDTEQPTIKMPAVARQEPQQTASPAPAVALPVPRHWPAESPHSAPKLLTVMQFVARHLIDTKYLDGALKDAATVLPTKSTQESIGKGNRLKLLEHWRTRREPGVQRCREGCECVDYLPG